MPHHKEPEEYSAKMPRTLHIGSTTASPVFRTVLGLVLPSLFWPWKRNVQEPEDGPLNSAEVVDH